MRILHLRLIAVALTLLLATPAWADTYVNEWTTVKDDYIVKGSGINYDPGTGLEPSSKTVKEAGPNIYVDEVGLPWLMKKSSGDITYSKDGQETTFGFDGLYWFNTVTELWTAVDTSASVTPVVVGDTVEIDSIYPGVDAVVVSSVSGPQVDYIITDMTGWVANPYGADGVLGFWHEMKTRGHGVKVDGVTWNGTDYTEGQYLTFTGDTTKDWLIIYTEAEDAVGEKTPVSNAVVRAVNKDFFAEAIDATWLTAATLPARVHYETEVGTMSADETWTAVVGTYFVDDVVYTSTYELTIEPNVTVKLNQNSGIRANSAGGNIILDGVDSDNHIRFTSCLDMTVGSAISDEDCDLGEPGVTAPGGGNWYYVWFDAVNEDILVDWVWLSYCWKCLQIDTTATPSAITVTNVKAEDSIGDPGMSWGISIITTGATATTWIIENNFVYKGNFGTSCPFEVNYSGSSNLSTGSFRNNFVLTDAKPTEIIMWRWRFGAPDPEIENNTVICTNADTSAPNVEMWYSNARNNVFAGCELVYMETGTLEYNVCYDMKDGDDDCGGTGNTYGDPAFGSHDDSADGWTPSWAEAYHVGAAGSAVDAGDTTAAAQLLSDTTPMSDLHTVTGGTNDSGTLDMGFHFGAFGVSAGGASRRVIITQLFPWRLQ
jgi:hypothetical protein